MPIAAPINYVFLVGLERERLAAPAPVVVAGG